MLRSMAALASSGGEAQLGRAPAQGVRPRLRWQVARKAAGSHHLSVRGMVGRRPSQINCIQATLVKVGPIGSVDKGTAVDIDWNRPPKELLSIEIWGNHDHGGMINAMSFTYRDEQGASVPVGPWGTKKGEKRTISIANNLVALTGSTTSSYVTSLTFKTSITRHDVYFFRGDRLSDDTFSIVVHPNSIVAFFGRSDESGLRAIGVYYDPGAAPTEVALNSFICTSLGRIEKTVSEILNRLKAFEKKVDDKFVSMDKRVSSIAKDIKTIKDGKEDDDDDDGTEVDSGSSSDGDDTNSSHYQLSMAMLKKVGPYGSGSLDGAAVDIDCNKPPKELLSIEIWSKDGPGGMINAISFTYRDENEGIVPVGPWGTEKGQKNTIPIEDGYLITLTASTNSRNVTSLTFKTNKSIYGPYGKNQPADTPFSIDVGPNSIVAFYGRADEGVLRAIGAYSGPRA